MEDIIENLIPFVGGAIASAGILKAYLLKYNIKLASVEKVQEYRQLKEIAVILTKNISREELLNILNYVIETKKNKDIITVQDVAIVGKMVFQAVTTEE